MITPEMSIAEVMRMDPEVAPVFMSYGIAPQVTAALRRVRAASSAALT